MNLLRVILRDGQDRSCVQRLLSMCKVVGPCPVLNTTASLQEGGLVSFPPSVFCLIYQTISDIILEHPLKSLKLWHREEFLPKNLRTCLKITTSTSFWMFTQKNEIWRADMAHTSPGLPYPLDLFLNVSVSFGHGSSNRKARNHWDSRSP